MDLNHVFYVTYALIHRDASKEDSDDDDKDEDDDEDSSDEDTDDDDEVENQAVKTPSQMYTALSDFKGEQEGDLSVQVKYLLIHPEY